MSAATEDGIDEHVPHSILSGIKEELKSIRRLLYHYSNHTNLSV